MFGAAPQYTLLPGEFGELQWKCVHSANNRTNVEDKGKASGTMTAKVQKTRVPGDAPGSNIGL